MSSLIRQGEIPLATNEQKKIIGKEDLSHFIKTSTQMSLKDADGFIDAFTETIARRFPLDIRYGSSAAGSWKLSNVAARTIKSIRGGTPVHLPAGKRVRFSTGSLLSEAAKARASSSKKASVSKQANKRAK